MLEIHNYDPWKYAGANPTVTSWGSQQDRADLQSWVDEIDAWAKSKGLKIYCESLPCRALGSVERFLIS